MNSVLRFLHFIFCLHASTVASFSPAIFTFNSGMKQQHLNQIWFLWKWILLLSNGNFITIFYCYCSCYYLSMFQERIAFRLFPVVIGLITVVCCNAHNVLINIQNEPFCEIIIHKTKYLATNNNAQTTFTSSKLKSQFYIFFAFCRFEYCFGLRIYSFCFRSELACMALILDSNETNNVTYAFGYDFTSF